MTNYYVKTRIQENNPVNLCVIENGRKTIIVMCFSSGYVSTMDYSDFNSRLSTAELFSNSDVIAQVRKELEAAIANPVASF